MHLEDSAGIDGGMMRALIHVSVKALKFARIGSRARSRRLLYAGAGNSARNGSSPPRHSKYARDLKPWRRRRP